MKNKKLPLSTSSLKKWLEYIGKQNSKTIDMDISRVKEVARYLNILKPASFVFIVAGTNGKGTTCRTLEMILLSAGYRVGVYSSPHLIHYTERVRIQNSELSEKEHINSFLKIESVRQNIPLTYFEYSTISALWLFKQKKLDVVVLEVGLGGRLDATNIVDADVAVLSNIALDHTDWLGKSRESIGREKAGIFRKGKPAIVGEINIPKSIFQTAYKKGAKLFCHDMNWQFSLTKSSWEYSDDYGKLINLPIPNIPLSNAATALAALRFSTLRIDHQSIRKGIKNSFLPGRFHLVCNFPRLILDVAHNPNAAKYLADRIKAMKKNERILAVVGMLYDKDISGTLFYMEKVVDLWYLATLEIERGAKAEHLKRFLKKGNIYENTEKAWKAAMYDANKEDIVIVFGSFNTVSHIIKTMKIQNIYKNSKFVDFSF